MTPEQEAKLNASIERDGADVVIERIEDLLTAGKVQGALDDKTDAEVADLLRHEADQLSITSPLHVLLDNAADRLRRANGGVTHPACHLCGARTRHSNYRMVDGKEVWFCVPACKP